ncbi:MAG: YceI family protein [Thermodesulfovibrionales bacterium]
MNTWIIDPDHSVAAFSIRHMMIARVRGQFNKVGGFVRFDPFDINGSSVELTIDASSVLSGVRKRDDHLMTADFLDTERYPLISFKSSQIQALASGRALVTGNLSLHGVTRSIAVEVSYTAPVKDPFGDGLSMGFAITATLNREDYGITWNQPMPDFGVMLGHEVELLIDLEADLAPG